MTGTNVLHFNGPQGAYKARHSPPRLTIELPHSTTFRPESAATTSAKGVKLTGVYAQLHLMGPKVGVDQSVELDV